MNPFTKRLTAALTGVALIAAVGAASCSSDNRQVIHASGPEYSSIEGLSTAADVIVIATATDSARHVIVGEGDGGIPTMYRVFTVDEVLFDPEGVVGDTIDVTLFDTDEVIFDGESEIATGQELLMFLDRVTADEVAAIRPLTQVFSPLSSDNGIFDVSDSGTITARSSAIRKLRAADETVADSPVQVTPEGEEIPEKQSRSFTSSLSEVRSVISTTTGHSATP
jgi:hypothetical protein